MILVTGGAGFIGSNLINALSLMGHKAYICDYNNRIRKEYFINQDMIEGLIDPSNIFEFINNNYIDIIFHLGAISTTTFQNNNKYWTDNVIFSTKLWNICAEKNIRLVYASSAATYGDGSLGFDDKDDIEYLNKLKALNVYGWTKNQIDLRNLFLKKNKKISPPQWVALKFFNVYGKNEFHKENMISIVLKTYIQIKRGIETSLFKSYKKIYEDGEQKRDFVYIKDCIEILLWFYNNQTINGIFNIGTGNSYTFNNLVNNVYKCLNKNINVRYIDMPENIKSQYQYETKANLDKLRSVGYREKLYSLKEGILDYIKILESSDFIS